MKNLINSVFISALCLLSVSSFAHENPDQKSTCYLFQNNQLKTKAPCVVKSGGGAGGMYTILKMGKKSYHFETSTMSEDMPTVYYQNDNVAKDVDEYSRDIKSLKPLTDEQSANVKNQIWCNRTKDKKLDICYQ